MSDWLQTNVVDVGVSEVISGTRHSNIEFAGKVGPVWVSSGLSDWVKTDQVVQGITQFTGVNQFLVINACQRRSNHISDAVQSGLERSLVACMKAIYDIRGVFNLDTPKLNISTSSDVNNTSLISILFNTVSIESHLVGVDNSIGDLETHHELTRSAFSSVKHTNIFQTAIKISLLDFFPSHFPFSDLAGIFVYVHPRIDRVLSNLVLFNWVSNLGSLDCFFWKE
mmetsp:Transcript_11140/g.26857  ORF Transcript_11140/g.26857 Transcript_11140/m.26857 type:complete len:225 (+) Transcript_11140:1335-2009(+)